MIMGILDEWGGTGFGFCYEYGSVFWGCVCVDKDGGLDWSALGVSSGFIVMVECEWFECCVGKKRKILALIEERENESLVTDKVSHNWITHNWIRNLEFNSLLISKIG